MQATKTKGQPERRGEATPVADKQRDPVVQDVIDSIDEVLDVLEEEIEEAEAVRKATLEAILDISDDLNPPPSDIIIATQEEMRQMLIEDGYILLPCGC